MLPATDALTSEAFEGLLDLDISKANKTTPSYLQMVMNALFGRGPQQAVSYHSTAALVKFTLDSMSELHNTVTVLPDTFLDATKKIAQSTLDDDQLAPLLRPRRSGRTLSHM